MISVFGSDCTDVEIAEVSKAIRNNWLGMGPQTRHFEEMMSEKIGCGFVAVDSCSNGLLMALECLNLTHGRQVILPAITWLSCANSIIKAGLKPVFADVDYETVNITDGTIYDAMTKNTAAIMIVHYAGMKVCSVGFESGNGRILTMIGKGTTVKQNYKAAYILHKYNVKIFANIMYGFPTETKDEQLDTFKLCKFIKRFDSMISPAYFTPFSGTMLGDECIQNGISLINKHGYVRYGRDKIAGTDYNFLDSFAWSL